MLSLQPTPFSFDQRDHEMMVKKEEKIRKVDFVKIWMCSKFSLKKKNLSLDHVICTPKSIR